MGIFLKKFTREFGFVTVFVIKARKYLWKKWSVLLIALMLLLIGINASENGSYFNRMGLLFSDSYKIVSNQSTGHEGSSRFFIWKKSLPLVKEYFWIGSGPDTFAFVFPDDAEKKEVFGDMIVDKAHNEYLQMAITLGVPALLTYLFLLFIILRNAFQALKRVCEQEKIILFGLISAILGYLVQAFFNISVIPVAPLFWSILGITMATSRLSMARSLEQASTMVKVTKIG